ncbi:MAG: ATP-binding protein [Candidatus Ornithomonoglobus sp.]
MIKTVNPYTPGSGRKPGYLAGRDSVLEEAERCILSTISGFPERSVAYYGLRGVGKTVLLNAIEDKAYDLDVLYQHFEIKESGSFINDIITASQNLISKMSTAQAVKEKLSKAINALKRITLTWNIENKSISAQLSDISVTTSFSSDLIELFVSIGKLAEATDNAICFFIDEIQYIKNEQLEALLMALHRVNQLGLPILIFCAGLPKILRAFGDIKSYAERLFQYTEIDKFDRNSAVKAIVEPAKKFDVYYSKEAIDKIIEVTGSYPYFIQELCNVIWSTSVSDHISIKNVLTALPMSIQNLDNGFFAVRYDKCTEREKDFMIAMVKCGELPCTMSNVAKIMHRSVKSISPIRGQLINKGVIYATSFGEIDFTVPQFDDFLKRRNHALL